MFPNQRSRRLGIVGIVFSIALAAPTLAAAQSSSAPFEYRVLATNKTSTMEKELNEAAEAGFRYADVMGGETSFGGSEVVAIARRAAGEKARYEYRLLATNKTSTMQKEIQAASDAGFEYVGQTVFKSAFGGKEVVCILERDKSVAKPAHYEYRLLATKKTATMQNELSEAGAAGYDVVGMTVAETAIGGAELVTITRRLLTRP
jgi:hypothetical protein